MGFTLYQTGILPGLPDKMVFEEDDITVGDFFQLLSAQYGGRVLEEVLDREGIVLEGTLVILNGHIIRLPDVLATLIPSESEMVLSVMIAGG